MASAMNIADVAIANGNFTTLVAALTAAELVDDLQGAGPFTVFAPTDAAFNYLSPGLVEYLLQPEQKAALESILLYHVLDGAVDKAINLAGQTAIATTLNGETIVLSLRDMGEDLYINEAEVGPNFLLNPLRST